MANFILCSVWALLCSGVRLFVAKCDTGKIALPLSSGADARVLFAACDPFCAFQACFEGVQVETDIFASSTGFSTSPRLST